MEQPEQINLREVKEFYGYKSKSGTVLYYFRFLYGFVLQTIAKISPHAGLTAALQRLRGVHVGKHVYIGPNTTIDELYPGLITIEDYVSIGMGTMIFAHSNPTCSLEIKQKYYPRKVKPVVIKRGSWIAPGCIILSGVIVGENSVIGAGSVITGDVEPYNVVAGNPARVIKKLNEATAPGEATDE